MVAPVASLWSNIRPTSCPSRSCCVSLVPKLRENGWRWALTSSVWFVPSSAYDRALYTLIAKDRVCTRPARRYYCGQDDTIGPGTIGVTVRCCFTSFVLGIASYSCCCDLLVEIVCVRLVFLILRHTIGLSLASQTDFSHANALAGKNHLPRIQATRQNIPGRG